MRRSLIPWHIFRDALESQNGESLQDWLERWGFTNDGVVLISVDIRSESQAPPFKAPQAGLDASALSRRPSLQDLVQLLIRDPGFLTEEAARLWCHNTEL
jgi:hypothetical protein